MLKIEKVMIFDTALIGQRSIGNWDINLRLNLKKALEKLFSGIVTMNRGGSHLRIANHQMTWLITGGSGQLGTAVSEELGERGLVFAAPESLELDISLSPIVSKFISQMSPEVIINCAAWTDVDGAETNELQAASVNRDGAENLAMGAKNCGAKLIHVSTDYVFSGEGKTPWQVDDRINPQSAYGRTKAESENRVLATYPENSSIVRTAWLYSPWGRNFAKTMTRLALKGEGQVRVVNDQMGQPTSAIDLAKQLVNLGLSSSPAGVYHGTNSGKGTWFDFAQVMFELAGADVNRVVPVSSSEYPQSAKRPSYSVLSHEAWAKTNVAPMRDWRIALKETMPAIISAVKAEG
jgi:dTDP-4-dehydrorhamnose reductase